MFRYFIPTTVFILCYSLITTLFFKVEDIANESNSIASAMNALLFVGFIIFMIVYCIITQVIVVVNFYQSMITDSGYLTHTLPVRKSTLLLSKYISGFIILALAGLTVIVSMIIFLDIPRLIGTYPSTVEEMLAEFSGITGIVAFFIAFIITLLVSFVFTLSGYYMSIAFGQKIGRHKIIGSIVAYGVTSIILNIFVNVIFISMQVFTLIITSSETLTITHVTILLYFSSVFFIVLSSIMAFITHRIFTRNLNLD